MKLLDMVRFRSILAVTLTVVLSWLLISGNPAEAARTSTPPTYTAAQLEKIQSYVADVEELHDRLLELPYLIQQENWVDVKSFIHGPLGDLRTRMFRIALSLDKKSSKTAQKAAREMFEHLVAIDEAADSQNVTFALRNYNEAIKDLDAFLQLIPS